MKSLKCERFCAWLTVTLAICCLVTSGSMTFEARAGHFQHQGKDIRVSVVPCPQPLVQGEPLTLRYKIENHWNRDVLTTFRFKGMTWFDVSLVRLDGSQIRAIFRRDYSRDGKAALISAGQFLPEERVIAGWETPPTPGQYQLRMSIQLPYGATAETFDDDIIAAGKKSIYRATLMFPITVLPADPVRLTKVAADIKQKLTTYGPYDTDLLCQQLFTMPQEYFHPVLVELAKTPNLEINTRQAVVEQLRLQKDTEAADLLEQMGWEIEYPKVGEREKLWQEDCIVALGVIYKGSDAALKSHIEEIFARHQATLPSFTKDEARR